MTITYATPAMKRAQERRARKIEELRIARDEIAKRYDQDFPSSVDLMQEVVRETNISLATVNLAYQQIKKSRLPTSDSR